MRKMASWKVQYYFFGRKEVVHGYSDDMGEVEVGHGGAEVDTVAPAGESTPKLTGDVRG